MRRTDTIDQSPSLSTTGKTEEVLTSIQQAPVAAAFRPSIETAKGASCKTAYMTSADTTFEDESGSPREAILRSGKFMFALISHYAGNRTREM